MEIGKSNEILKQDNVSEQCDIDNSSENIDEIINSVSMWVEWVERVGGVDDVFIKDIMEKEDILNNSIEQVADSVEWKFNKGLSFIEDIDIWSFKEWFEEKRFNDFTVMLKVQYDWEYPLVTLTSSENFWEEWDVAPYIDLVSPDWLSSTEWNCNNIWNLNTWCANDGCFDYLNSTLEDDVLSLGDKIDISKWLTGLNDNSDEVFSFIKENIS